MPALMIVVYANPFAVIVFARNGKIARRAPMIVEYALMRPCVETLHVMAKKHVARALGIGESVHQFAVMGHVKVPTEKTVDHVQAIVVHVSLIVGMEFAKPIIKKTASYVLGIVANAPHQILCVAMGSVTEPKHVMTALATVPVPAHALRDKCAMIQMCV